ncbi:hypothetical protein ElyMa_001393200 [Elysia marginata]|uniref:Ig-like domain-containing protein n=1 Tax=Elysia marginata TaxID=1093978 RepID=A0AAV4ISH3_9GAST|nr:hypothetical protein ElyMa_001393200 [Elysia marginata]
MKKETVLLFFIIVEPACGPVEEGQSTNLTCDVNTAGCLGPIVSVWQTEGNGYATLVSCNSYRCDGIYSSDFPTTISSTRSTLTISNVSRVTPFNMETKWACNPCNRGYRTVCDELQIFGGLKLTLSQWIWEMGLLCSCFCQEIVCIQMTL